MVQVPVTSRNSVQVQPLGQERFRYASPRNTVGPAIEEFGRTLGNAAEGVNQIDMARAENAAREADAQTVPRLAEIEGRFRALRGTQATPEAMAEATAEFGRLREERTRGLNPRAARLYGRLFDQRSAAVIAGLQSHSLEQVRVGRIDTAEARIAAAGQAAVEGHANIETFSQNLETIEVESLTLADAHGWSEDRRRAFRAEAVSGVHRRVVETLRASGEEGPVLADQWLNRYGTEIGDEDERQLRESLRGPLDEIQAINDYQMVREAETTTPAAPAEGTSPREPGQVRATGAAAQLAQGLNSLPQPVVAGFLANIQAESNFDSSRPGDNGTAFGHAQWRAERVTNFQRIIGVHPRNATAAQSARFILWEMQNPRQAGMTVQQRDAILAARTPEDAARLIDQYYERSNGQTRNARATAARGFYTGRELSTPQPSIGGTEQRYAAAQQVATREGWSQQRLDRVLARIDADANRNRALLSEQETVASRDVAAQVARVGADRITNASQLGESYYRLSPTDRVAYDNLIQRNNEQQQELANWTFLEQLQRERYENPEAFLRRNVAADLARLSPSQQASYLGWRLESTASQAVTPQERRAQEVEFGTIMNVSRPFLETALGPRPVLEGRPDNITEADWRTQVQQNQQAYDRLQIEFREDMSHYIRRWQQRHPGEPVSQDVIYEMARRLTTSVINPQGQRVPYFRTDGRFRAATIPNDALRQIEQQFVARYGRRPTQREVLDVYWEMVRP